MGKYPGLKLQAATVQDNVPIEIAPRLFIGSIHAAFNVDALKEKHITHIVNLAGNYATFPDAFTYLSINIRDKDYSNLLSCLPLALIFIDAGMKQGGGVLVHCAGGRSRSPALAMSYMIIHDHISYENALARVLALRPVVSLNAGFAAQLMCLDETHGDIFGAHQQMLLRRLRQLAEQREDGALVLEIESQKKQHRRHHKHHSHHHDRHHSKGDLRSHMDQRSIQFCDERGMLHGRVPSGFCLSVPTTPGTTETSKTHVSNAHFIPTLRSMGTMFGCRECGENLFCASAIVAQNQRVEAQAEEKAMMSVEAIADSSAKEQKKEKRPLLAKLRLRPQSPGVMASENPKAEAKDQINLFPRTPPPRHSVLRTVKIEKEKQGTRDHSIDNSHHNGFWRVLASFTSSKRLMKEVSDKENAPVRVLNDNTKNKNSVTGVSPKTIDLASRGGESYDESEDGAHAAFLRENAQQWERKVRLIEHCCSGTDLIANTNSAFSGLVAALVAHDTKVFSAMTESDFWCVEPQLWFMGSEIIEQQSGNIVCPNSSCGATLGVWQWGEECVSSSSSTTTTDPLFQLHKSALRVLGNLTISPEQLMNDEPPLQDNSCLGIRAIPPMTPRLNCQRDVARDSSLVDGGLSFNYE